MNLSVRTYLIVAFVFVSGLPLAIFWSWPYSRILEAEKVEVHERHLLIAENLASVLELYHRDLTTALEAFRDSIAAGGGIEAKALFLNLRFRHICVAHKDSGAVLDSYLDEANACPGVIPAQRLAMLRGLATGDGVGISHVVAPKGERPRIFLATRSGAKLIVGAVHTDFFEELRRQVKFGRDGHAAIVDQTGRALAHPIPDWAYRAADMSDVPPVARILRGEKGVETFFSPAKEQKMISGFATVPNIGWGVIVPQPLSELEELAAQFNSDALWVLSLGLGFSLVMAFFVSTKLSRRLKRIAAGVHEVARENDNAHIPATHQPVSIRELAALEADVNWLASSSTAARSARSADTNRLREANRRLTQEMDDRKAAETARHSIERRFRSLFENAPIPIREEDLSGMQRMVRALDLPDWDEFQAYLDANPDFVERAGKSIVVMDANQASLALHGYTDKQALLARVVQTLSKDALKIVRQTLEAMHRGQGELSYETRITRTDGTVRTVAATWSVLPGYEESYARILLTSVDLTARLESEEALRQAQKMEAVGQLTGGVAHDFNNLMTVIGGNIELMKLTGRAEPEFTAPVLRAVERGAELTQRLLAFARNQPLMPRVIDMNELVVRMVKLMRRSLGEEVAIHVADVGQPVCALADPGQVEAALLNFALNARDAMPDGGELSIGIDCMRVGEGNSCELAPGKYAVLTVTDTGEGMTQEVLARACEPFFTTKEVGKGSGLGLSMVYGFAKQSKGDLVINSEAGVGTKVALFLPWAEGIEQVAEGRPPGAVNGGGKGQRILILEDDPDVRSFLLRLVVASGYHGVPASDAHAARRVLDRGDRIDLLISDVMLPGGVRGPEFAEEMLERLPGTPVIFITGRPADAVEPDIDSLKGAPILAKPFDRESLIRTIEATIAPVPPGVQRPMALATSDRIVSE